jgi:hypothetical protein
MKINHRVHGGGTEITEKNINIKMLCVITLRPLWFLTHLFLRSY